MRTSQGSSPSASHGAPSVMNTPLWVSCVAGVWFFFSERSAFAPHARADCMSPRVAETASAPASSPLRNHATRAPRPRARTVVSARSAAGGGRTRPRSATVGAAIVVTSGASRRRDAGVSARTSTVGARKTAVVRTRRGPRMESPGADFGSAIFAMLRPLQLPCTRAVREFSEAPVALEKMPRGEAV